MELLLMLVLGVAIAIGAIAGICKGYVKTSFWGGTVVLALLISRIIGSAVSKEGGGFGIIVLIVTLASLLLLMLVFAILRKIMVAKIEARRTLSEYQNHDALEENEAYILNAVDSNDKREYKKYKKQRRKIKTKSGVWGVLSRIFGGVFGALNAFVGAFVVIAFVILFIDLTRISALTQAFESVLTSGLWTDMLGKVAMDMLALSLLSLAIRAGYKSGISSVLNTVIILGLIVAFAFASFNLASSEAMAGMVEGLENGILSSLPAMLGELKHTVAIIVTAVIFFLLSLIIVIIVAIFLPKFVEKFRENKVFGTVDGVIGAVVFTAFILALLLVFGGVAYTLCDLPVMERVNAYMETSFFADCLYSCNPLGAAFEGLPLRSWFGGNTAQ